MWPVLRTHVFLQVKHSYKWKNHHPGLVTVKSCYKIACDDRQFQFSKRQPIHRQFSTGNTYNRDMGKRYDKYFHFIHENDLYQNTTLNYNVLSEPECKEEMPNLLNKIVVPTSILGKNMQQLTDDELQQVMICLIKGKLSHNLKILHYLDEECAKRTLKWTVVSSLYMLDGWIMLDEKFTLNGKFFNVLRNLWCQQLRHCTKENLVQIVYYLGRSKHPAPTLLSDRMEKLLLQHREGITLNEWGIICNGFFKMKTKIKSANLLHHIADFVMQQLKHHDKYILISILKAFRHSCYFDEKFIRFLEKFTIETYTDYNVLECAHFLAMFANVGWYNQEIFDSLEVQAISKLVSAREMADGGSYALSDVRIKDVARLLWSMSHTVHKPKSDAFFETVTNIIVEFMNKDFSRNVPFIIDCAQSLIVMGYYCDNILHKLLTKDTFQKLRQSVKRKPFNQLYFIYSSAGIEASLNRNLSEDIFEMHSPLKSTYKDTRERAGIEQLIMVMRRYCTEKEEFTHSFILPHITISSICIQAAIASSEHSPDMQITSNSGNRQLKICLEVLDPTVCLENHENRMTGLMVTKIRQLRKLNYGIVLFTPEAVMRLTEMTTDNLRMYIDNLFIKVTTESVVTIK